MIYWNYLITFYLFSAGISAGAMTVSITASMTDAVKYAKVVRAGAYIAPFPILAGMVGLIFDLERPGLFWLLLTTFQYNSIMSVGAWIITLFCATSIVYLILNLPADYLKLKTSVRFMNIFRLCGLVLSTCVALYTGLLLSTLTARPLWNTPMTAGILFISAMVDGLAAVSLVLSLNPHGVKAAADKSVDSDSFIHRVDFILLYLLLLATVVFLIGLVRSTEGAVSALGVMTSGKLGGLFWYGFVAAGSAVPFLIAAYKLGARVRRPWLNVIPAVLSLVGGYIIRSVLINAGQLTGAVLF